MSPELAHDAPATPATAPVAAPADQPTQSAGEDSGNDRRCYRRRSSGSINVTLLFSLSSYAQVIEAYQSGLEKFTANDRDPTIVNSVASFFVSRVDTEVDQRLGAIGTDEALGLRGQAAVAR